MVSRKREGGLQCLDKRISPRAAECAIEESVSRRAIIIPLCDRRQHCAIGEGHFAVTSYIPGLAESYIVTILTSILTG